MQRNHGIDVNGEKICALLYADDLLIIGQSAEQNRLLGSCLSSDLSLGLVEPKIKY